MSLSATRCRDAIPENQCSSISTRFHPIDYRRRSDEWDQQDQNDNPLALTCVSYCFGVVISTVEHFGRIARLFFRRRQEKLGPRIRRQQGIEPLKFAIHLYNDHSCSLNDAISPIREKEEKKKEKEKGWISDHQAHFGL
jgi:hypothetical protein